MLRHLFKNIAVSAVGFFAVSIVGLVLVPTLIGAFGVDGFGIISLARLFTPTAILGIFDLGFGETATQTIAKARNDSNWIRAFRLLRMTLFLAGFVGIFVGFSVCALSHWLPKWLGVKLSEQDGLQNVLRATALLLPIQFISLVFEGVLKGFELFGALRTLEIVVAILYAVLVLSIVQSGGTVYIVCYALLGTLMLRSIASGMLAVWVLRPNWGFTSGIKSEELTWFLQITQGMAANKALGVSQTQIAPLCIGLLFGPSGAGGYDALSRLPRAVKGILGLLSSTVLPLAARLENSTDTLGMRRLGQAGVIVIGIIALPPVVCGIVFSEPLLFLWLGPELARMWGWQAAMFTIPGLTVLISFGGTALLVRPSVISQMNRWVGLQIAIQFLLAAVALPWLSERAFILGQVLAVAITFAPQLRIVCIELNISILVLKRLLKVVLAQIVLGGLAIWFSEDFHSWSKLILAMVIWTVIGWALGLRLGLVPQQKKRLISLLRNKVTSLF